jgi:hypothetical protein
MCSELPEGWERPTQFLQGELFGKPRDFMLAVYRVSIDDMELWRSRGWISCDVRELATMYQPQIVEMAFIRNLAHSGLSKPQIDSYLSELEKPYRYDPIRVAYSFAHGWVQIPRLPNTSERDEYMRDNITAWIADLELRKDLRVLENIAYRVIQATARMRSGEITDEDDGDT